MQQLAARLRRLFHWWTVFGKAVVWMVGTDGEGDVGDFTKHRSLTTYDPGRQWGNQTIDISCECGKVFWTRRGYMERRSKDWAARRDETSALN